MTLDSSSRTSHALLKILFRQKYNVSPEFAERTPDPSRAFENMFEDSDAALIIGDPAMRLAASAERLSLTIYDLADEWRELTGLPFVFAVWATRPRDSRCVSEYRTGVSAGKSRGTMQDRAPSSITTARPCSYPALSW